MNSALSDIKKAFSVPNIRQDFPILKRKVNGQDLIFFDNAASSQKPDQVLRAMDNYYQSIHANVHRGVHTLSQEATEEFELSRKVVAQFLGASSPDEIIFTRGTTESINLISYSFGLSRLVKDDEILVSGLEHHSNIVPWQIVSQMREAKVRHFNVLPDGTLDMENFKASITPRTKFIAVNHISNSLGTINPIEDIIRIAHDHSIPVLIDGAQAAPHLKIDVQKLDADFYVLSSHKMYGPTGMGVLYGKRKWLDALPPWQGGGEMIKEVSFSGTTYNEIPFKFEAGTPDIAGAIGLKAAIEYLQQFNHDDILHHEESLLATCTSLMSELPEVIPVGTARHKAGVYSFNVAGVHPYDVGVLLDQQGVAVRTGHHCTQPLMKSFGIPGTVRASFAIYNTIEEVEKFVHATKRAIKMLT